MRETPKIGADVPTRTDLAGRATRTLATVVAAGMRDWDREAMLPRLIPVGPTEIADVGRGGRLAILRRLAGALRGERVRGRAGHWSYSLDRHIALVQAIAAERRAFTAAIGPVPRSTAPPPSGDRAAASDRTTGRLENDDRREPGGRGGRNQI